jgi:hypothetical protein
LAADDGLAKLIGMVDTDALTFSRPSSRPWKKWKNVILSSRLPNRSLQKAPGMNQEDYHAELTGWAG